MCNPPALECKMLRNQGRCWAIVLKIKYQSSESNTEVRSTVVSRYDQAFTGTLPQLRRNVSALSDMRFQERVKLGRRALRDRVASRCVQVLWRLYASERLSLLSGKEKDGGVAVREQFGVDPSYVSRVARGERMCPKIEMSLNREVLKLLTSISVRTKAKKE